MHDMTQKSNTFLPPYHLGDRQELAFYKIRLKGTFQHDREQHLLGRLHAGRLGVHILTPFLISNARVILVDRGWCSLQKIKSFWRPQEEILLEGYLVAASQPSFWTPLNDPAARTWHWIELSKMVPHGFQHLFVRALREGERSVISHPSGGPLELSNPHLSYAWTWFLLAVGILFIGGIYFKVNPKDLASWGRSSQ